MMQVSQLTTEIISLLKELISIPSFSKEEDKTADIIYNYLQSKNISTNRMVNNVFAYNHYFSPNKPTILLNSHHDTVKPNPGYTKDPFSPIIEEGKLYGLGSNDAGGCLASLLATFLYFYHRNDLKYNLCFAATAEEEISGSNGIELFIKESASKHILGKNKDDFAIIGEPTGMHMAVAEKGLMVLDCKNTGKSGHAARDEGINALYLAMKDLEWFKSYTFERISPFLGPVKMSVTSIHTENKAHNVVPDTCHFIVDIRVNELYTFDEILHTIRQNVKTDVTPRSTRIKSSMIAESHPIVLSGIELGKTLYGSPTTSDKALVGIPALKIGPGDSARSHSADEYIYLHEIEHGIKDYIHLLEKVIL